MRSLSRQTQNVQASQGARDVNTRARPPPPVSVSESPVRDRAPQGPATISIPTSKLVANIRVTRRTADGQSGFFSRLRRVSIRWPRMSTGTDPDVRAFCAVACLLEAVRQAEHVQDFFGHVRTPAAVMIGADPQQKWMTVGSGSTTRVVFRRCSVET